MNIIEQGYQIISLPDELLETLEQAGRTCYKSEHRITPESAPKFVKMLRDRGHHAMIEFGDIMVKFITNRGVTHELVRHRHCSFAQESTRYVHYKGDMAFIKPVWCSDNILGQWGPEPWEKETALEPSERLWLKSMKRAELEYGQLSKEGWKPQQAREVLPNSLKTEIVVKANIREWRHIFSLRCAKAAHPQIRALMASFLQELKTRLPVVFDDI